MGPSSPEAPEAPGRLEPMAIELPGKTALLLVHLARELGADSPGEVVAQALGLLQMVRQAKARGQRVVVRDEQGRDIDLAI